MYRYQLISVVGYATMTCEPTMQCVVVPLFLSCFISLRQMAAPGCRRKSTLVNIQAQNPDIVEKTKQ